MSRSDFINKLRKELARLPKEEVDAAIQYYEEYLDEAGPEREEEIIREWGSPKKLAAQIKSDYAVRSYEEDEKPTVKRGISTVWRVIIGICAAPVALPLAILIGAIAIALFVSAIAVLISVFASIIGCAIAALCIIVIGITSIGAAGASGVMLIGMGVTGLGVLALIGFGVFVGVRTITRAIIKSAKKSLDKRGENQRSARENQRPAREKQSPALSQGSESQYDDSQGGTIIQSEEVNDNE